MAIRSNAILLSEINKSLIRSDIPEFRSGDTVKVHAKIVEGNKERIQVFEGVVIKRAYGNKSNATFTVRKISYGVGVERTFLLHSPRIDKIEIASSGRVRRSRLFYIRPLRGKAARIKQRYLGNVTSATSADTSQIEDNSEEVTAEA